ncbi:MAG: S9 family peptidase, partial [Saprospiraceae bacterium]
MKFQIALFLSVSIFTLSSCKKEAETARMPKQYSSDQLRANIAVGAVGYNKEESQILMHSNVSGRFNVYQVSVADTSAMALTKSTTDANYAIGFMPGSNKFLISHDAGGDENNHIYMMSRGDSTGEDLTPWPKSKNSFFDWTKDKKTAYISSNKRDERYFDIWKMDTSSWQPVMFYQNDSSLDATLISSTGRYVVLT